MASSSLRSFVDLRSGKPRRLQPPTEALARPFTPAEAEIAAFFRRIAIVGTKEQVRAEIEARALRTQADEVMVSTLAYDPDARKRSYELVASAFGA